MRIKKFMAIAIATVLAFSSMGVVYASDITEPTGSQEGQVDGDSTYVDTIKYKVTLPTTESLGFNIDPLGLYGYFSAEGNEEATAVDPGDLTEYAGKIASTGYATVSNRSSIPVVVTCSFNVETSATGIVFKTLTDELDEEAKEIAIGIIPVVNEEPTATNSISVYSSDASNPNRILFGLQNADYEFTFDAGEYDYEQKEAGDGVVDVTNTYFQVGGNVSTSADWSEIGEDGNEVNLNCVFSFIGAKVMEEEALAADDSGVVVDEEKITYLVEPEPEPDPTTPARFQTIAVAGGEGVDVTQEYTVEKGLYTKVGSAFLLDSADTLGAVKINGVVKEVATKGNSSGNGDALWFKFAEGTVLQVGDVITAEIGEVTYSFTVAE